MNEESEKPEQSNQPVHINASVEKSILSVAIGMVQKIEMKSDPDLALRSEVAPSCHDDIEWLQQHKHFTTKELAVAVKRRALLSETGQLTRGSVWADRIALATFMPVVFLMLLFSVPAAFNTPGLQGLLAWALLTMSTLAGFGVLAVFHWPQRTAAKAVAALATRPQQGVGR